ncbi:PucR family transcriptional regulator [Streptomyces globosus]|uniref:PucR family transcriptional regulator n=1 Tax=Streptomyces globosus TaxID=68209 RepID=UPI001FECA65B|nr:helix-turn-helix domain-containing protein [Streptomyces globosus]
MPVRTPPLPEDPAAPAAPAAPGAPGGVYRAIAAADAASLAAALHALPDFPHTAAGTTAVVCEPPDTDPATLAARLRAAGQAAEAAGLVGIGAAVPAPEDLPASLAQARFALACAAGAPGGVAAADELDTLSRLLPGIPAEVRDIYATRLLRPLGEGPLRATLEAFLAHDCSWSRTAEALGVHVNTVHYRIERIEALTDRDLTRLPDRLDLYTALCCAGGRA